MIYDYDLDADVLYLRLSKQPVRRTEKVDVGTMVDLDDAGGLIGIEVLHPARDWPLGDVIERFSLASSDVTMLRALFSLRGMVPSQAPVRD